MASNPINHFWTIEEYLAYEDITRIRHEYIDGEIYARVGLNARHNRINVNTSYKIGGQVRNSPFQGYGSDLCIKISDTKYVYPDMSVVCGKSLFADAEQTLLKNPIFVLEIYSPESIDYDKGRKADFYRSLSSLQTYLLLEQNRPFAQLYIRDEDEWRLKEFSGLDAVVPLESIGCTLALSEAYRNVAFDEK
jgi:Uma2 family endonuclease